MRSEMYSRYAREYDHAARTNIFNALYERPSLQALLTDLKGAHILDLGCGSGIYAEYLLAQGAGTLTCIDASEKMIEIVQELFGERVYAYVQDLGLGLPQEADGSADIIVCPLMIHYLKELGPFFKEVARVLKPGGYIAFSTHHPFADFGDSPSGNYYQTEQLCQEWNTIGTPVQVQFYRRPLRDITEAITDAGLSIGAMTEGIVDPKIKSVSQTAYTRLSTGPNFIFMKCYK